MSQAKYRYPVIFSILFWLLWLLGVGVFFVYLSLATTTLGGGYMGGASLIGVWNLLITMTEGFGLFISAVWFLNGAKSATVLMLLVFSMVIVVPLIGFGGCVMQ